jgi:hypothetical protein
MSNSTRIKYVLDFFIISHSTCVSWTIYLCCIGICGATCIHGIITNMGIKKHTIWEWPMTIPTLCSKVDTSLTLCLTFILLLLTLSFCFMETPFHFKILWYVFVVSFYLHSFTSKSTLFNGYIFILVYGQ